MITPRLEIITNVIATMGTSLDWNEYGSCPVIAEVERRWRVACLDAAPWNQPEVALVMGLAPIKVSEIERGALATMRRRMLSMGIVSELRERDSMRDDHTEPEAFA